MSSPVVLKSAAAGAASSMAAPEWGNGNAGTTVNSPPVSPSSSSPLARALPFLRHRSSASSVASNSSRVSSAHTADPLAAEFTPATTSWLGDRVLRIHKRLGGRHSSIARDPKKPQRELDVFIDASLANRRAPLIANQRRKLVAMWTDDLSLLEVRGDLLVVPSDSSLNIWSEKEAESQSFFGGDGTISAICISQSGRYIWVGTNNGTIYEVDTKDLAIVGARKDAHHRGVTHIFRCGLLMVSLDASGTLVTWLPDAGQLSSLHGPSISHRIPPTPAWAAELNGSIWVFWIKHSHRTGDRRSCELRVYDISGSTVKAIGQHAWELAHPGSSKHSDTLGIVTSATIVPSQPDVVFVGHASGHISVFDRLTAKLLTVQQITSARITALLSPSRFLWVGLDSGVIAVLDVEKPSWQVIKRWKAHKGPVIRLTLDTYSVWTASSLRVLSGGSDDTIRYWDGFLRRDWLDTAVTLREASYSSYKPVKVNCLTWNVGAVKPAKLQYHPEDASLLHDFLSSSSVKDPDILSFGLQEAIDLSNLSLAARTIIWSTPERDATSTYRKWTKYLRSAIAAHLGPDYTLLNSSNLVGLYSAIFVKTSIAARVRDLAVTRTKTGFDNGYGNKGAVIIRFVLDDSSFCFLNCHLAAGEEHTEARRQDVNTILSSPLPLAKSTTQRAFVARGDGTEVADTELTFFFGDLNSRIAMPRADIISAIEQGQLDDLLDYDELLTELLVDPSCLLSTLGFKEDHITFQPTFKYDVGSKEYDTSYKQRSPRWCDRILYRAEKAGKIRPLLYRRYEATASDHRPVSAAFEVMVKSVDPAKQDKVWRKVIRDWGKVELKLLEESRSYFPPGEGS